MIMKITKLILTALLLLFFVACDNDKEEAKDVTIELNDISASDAETLSESLESDEDDLTDDFDETFDVFNEGASKSAIHAKKVDGYDSLTGYWTRTRNLSIDRTDSIRYNDRLKIRQVSFSGSAEIKARFSDAEDNSIQFPGKNRLSINTVHIIRNRDVTANATVQVFQDGVEISNNRERVRDAAANHEVTLTRVDEGDRNFYANISGTKDVDVEITRNDTIIILNRSYSISTDELVIRRGLFGRTRIVSGKITRNMTFPNSTVEVVTEFFENGDREDKARYIRNFYKNGSTAAFKTVYVYYQ